MEGLLHPDKLVPKKWQGKVMKQKELLNLLLASNEAFGDGRVPKPENILTVCSSVPNQITIQVERERNL